MKVFTNKKKMRGLVRMAALYLLLGGSNDGIDA